MAIVRDGSSLTVPHLVRIARGGEKVELSLAALERIRACRAVLEEKDDAHEIMNRVDTGTGDLPEVVLHDELVKGFQRDLKRVAEDSTRIDQDRGSVTRVAGMEARRLVLPSMITRRAALSACAGSTSLRHLWL